VPWQHTSYDKQVPLSLGVIKVAKLLQPLLASSPNCSCIQGKKNLKTPSCFLSSMCCEKQTIQNNLYQCQSHIQ